MAVLFRIDTSPGASSAIEGGGDFFYERPVDGAIAAYPSVYIADALAIVSSRFALNTASPSDWQTCGMWLNPIGSTPGGGVGGFAASDFLNLGQAAGAFYLEAVFHPTSQSLADINYAPLIWLTAPNSDPLLGVFIDDPGGAPALEVYRQLYFGDGSPYWSELNPDFTTPPELQPADGTPYKVRLEWQCGTYNGSTHAFDGWFKLYINDTLVTEQSGLRLNLEFSTNPVDMVGWAAVGFDGTLGPWDYFEIGSIEEEVDDGGCEDPTIYYSQDFTSGTPLFHTDSVYDRNGGDAADPNYPEISYAEGLILNGSGHVDSGHGYNYSANSLGIGEWFGFVNDLPGGPIFVPEGYLQIHYKANATSITKDADILWIYRDNGDFLSLSRDAGDNTLLIEGWNEDQSVHLDESISWTPTTDQEYIFRWEFKIGSGGYLRLKINGTEVFEDLTFEPWFDGVDGTQIKTISIGGFALFGEFWDIELGTCSADAVVPPMQRASYVFFSNSIVEKQAEARLTRTYLQLLTADTPAATAPVVLTLTEVTGNLYDQEGNTITTGSLHIAPRSYIVVDEQLIAAIPVTYNITGPVSINLAPSSTVFYDVEYDPDPNDTATPRNLKSGFFRAVWQIPNTGIVDISDL
jgi:hypothetical protein